MKVSMYAIFDSKAGFFGSPFVEHRDESAIRSFTDVVNDASNPRNMWHFHSEDFSLMKIAEYDDVTGVVKPLLHQSLVSASAVKKVVPQLDLFSKNDVDQKVSVS